MKSFCPVAASPWPPFCSPPITGPHSAVVSSQGGPRHFFRTPADPTPAGRDAVRKKTPCFVIRHPFFSSKAESSLFFPRLRGSLPRNLGADLCAPPRSCNAPKTVILNGLATSLPNSLRRPATPQLPPRMCVLRPVYLVHA